MDHKAAAALLPTIDPYSPLAKHMFEALCGEKDINDDNKRTLVKVAFAHNTPSAFRFVTLHCDENTEAIDWAAKVLDKNAIDFLGRCCLNLGDEKSPAVETAVGKMVPKLVEAAPKCIEAMKLLAGILSTTTKFDKQIFGAMTPPFLALPLIDTAGFLEDRETVLARAPMGKLVSILHENYSLPTRIEETLCEYVYQELMENLDDLAALRLAFQNASIIQEKPAFLQTLLPRISDLLHAKENLEKLGVRVLYPLSSYKQDNAIFVRNAPPSLLDLLLGLEPFIWRAVASGSGCLDEKTVETADLQMQPMGTDSEMAAIPSNLCIFQAFKIISECKSPQYITASLEWLLDLAFHDTWARDELNLFRCAVPHLNRIFELSNGGCGTAGDLINAVLSSPTRRSAPETTFGIIFSEAHRHCLPSSEVDKLCYQISTQTQLSITLQEVDVDRSINVIHGVWCAAMYSSVINDDSSTIDLCETLSLISVEKLYLAALLVDFKALPSRFNMQPLCQHAELTLNSSSNQESILRESILRAERILPVDNNSLSEAKSKAKLLQLFPDFDWFGLTSPQTQEALRNGVHFSRNGDGVRAVFVPDVPSFIRNLPRQILLYLQTALAKRLDEPTSLTLTSQTRSGVHLVIESDSDDDYDCGTKRQRKQHQSRPLQSEA